jgi:hypothetical protein
LRKWVFMFKLVINLETTQVSGIPIGRSHR